MKSDRWLYRSDGDEFGPVPFDVILQLARSGSLNRRDEVCREGGPWGLAGDIVGLFDEPESAAQNHVPSPDADWQFEDVLQSAPDADAAPGGEFDDVLRFAPAVDGTPVQTTAASVESEVSASGFLCRIAGAEVGPLTLDALRSWAAQGRLSAGDEVRPVDGELWLPAGDIDGLRFNPSRPRASAAGELRRAGSPQDLESLALDVLSTPETSRRPGSRDLEGSTADACSSASAQNYRLSRPAAALRPLMAAALADEPRSRRSPRRMSELGLPSSPVVYALAAVIVLAAAVKLWPENGGALRGRVLVDGKPVPIGSIGFVSGGAPNTETSFAAVILQGAYEIADRTSLPAESYNVVVTIGTPLGEPPPEIAEDSLFAPLNGGRFSQTNVSPDPDSRVLDFSFSAADAQWPAQGEGPQGQDILRLQ